VSKDLVSANPKKVSCQILLLNCCEEAIGIGDVETSLQILLGLNFTYRAYAHIPHYNCINLLWVKKN
jgi:hypothetical protein